MTTLTRKFGLTGTTDAIDVKVETVFTEAFQSDTLDCCHNLRGCDLRHLPTGRADLMTVIVVAIECLVFRDSLDVMTHHQTDIHKEVKGIVKRSPTDRESIFLCQFVFEFIKGEMSFMVIDGAQDGITLRCLAMTGHLKIVIQNACYSSIYPQKPYKGTHFQADEREFIYKNSKLACFNALLAIRSYTSPKLAKRCTAAIAALRTGMLSP